jgi:heme A synthase
MRTTYRVLAWLIVLGVVFQAAAIALGVFGLINDVEDGLIVDRDYEPHLGFVLHHIGGNYLIPLFALLLLVVSFFARIPGGVKWALGVFGLVVLQYALALVAFILAIPFVGWLHGINAFVLAGVADAAARRVKRVTEEVPTQVEASV